MQSLNVGYFERALFRLTFFILRPVPSGLLKFDAQLHEIFEQNFVQRGGRLHLFLLNAVTQGTQIFSIAGGVAIVVNQSVLFSQYLMIAFHKQIALSMPLVELLVVDPHQPDERIARQNVEINVGQRFQLPHALR